MVYSAVVEDKNALWSRIRVHNDKQTAQPLKKLVSIVAANLDVTVDKPVRRDCR
jgi:hypothetical protein